MRVLRVLGFTVLMLFGIWYYFWTSYVLADDDDFQKHPQGDPFNEHQQAEYRKYQVMWSIAITAGVGGVIGIIYEVRKKPKPTLDVP